MEDNKGRCPWFVSELSWPFKLKNVFLFLFLPASQERCASKKNNSQHWSGPDYDIVRKLPDVVALRSSLRITPCRHRRFCPRI